MKEIIDIEIPEVCREVARRKKKNAIPLEINHRPFYEDHQLSVPSVLQDFLDPSMSDEDKVNALLRLRHISRESGNFKGFSRDEVDEQARRAYVARMEVQKLKSLLDKDELPPEMATPVKNLLQTH